jgi:hypothetical protein
MLGWQDLRIAAGSYSMAMAPVLRIRVSSIVDKL